MMFQVSLVGTDLVIVNVSQSDAGTYTCELDTDDITPLAVSHTLQILGRSTVNISFNIFYQRINKLLGSVISCYVIKTFMTPLFAPDILFCHYLELTDWNIFLRPPILYSFWYRCYKYLCLLQRQQRCSSDKNNTRMAINMTALV